MARLPEGADSHVSGASIRWRDGGDMFFSLLGLDDCLGVETLWYSYVRKPVHSTHQASSLFLSISCFRKCIQQACE